MAVLLPTTRFGTLTIDDSEIYSFPEGIPGFPDERQFVLLKVGLEETPFHWLQSAQDGALCFLTIDPNAVFADYTVALHDDAMATLGAEFPDQLQLLCIVTVPEGQFGQATANLKAPVVINPRTRRGVQVILDEERYPIRQPIFTGKGE